MLDVILISVSAHLSNMLNDLDWRFPSDDKVEGLRLSSAFDITCRAWKERFKIQYTHCGCPVPGDSIGERLSKLVKLYSSPPQSDLLLIDCPVCLSATHPSEHNAVHFIPRNLQGHILNSKRYAQLAQKKRKAALRHMEKVGKDSSSACLQRSTCVPPFLVPVPTYYGGVTIGDCVADSRAV